MTFLHSSPRPGSDLSVLAPKGPLGRGATGATDDRVVLVVSWFSPAAHRLDGLTIRNGYSFAHPFRTLTQEIVFRLTVNHWGGNRVHLSKSRLRRWIRSTWALAIEMGFRQTVAEARGYRSNCWTGRRNSPMTPVLEALYTGRAAHHLDLQMSSGSNCSARACDKRTAHGRRLRSTSGACRVLTLQARHLITNRSVSSGDDPAGDSSRSRIRDRYVDNVVFGGRSGSRIVFAGLAPWVSVL
jgi:hypothetical protein